MSLRVNYAKNTALYIGLATEEQVRTGESKTIKGELTYEGYERIKLNLAEWEEVAGTEGEHAYLLNKLAIQFALNKNTTGTSKATNFFITTVAKSSEAGPIIEYGKLEEELNIVKALTEAAFGAKKLKLGAE